MKSYTDIEQSKKLAEILPIETADMGYLWNGTSFCNYPVSNQTIFKRVENVPCWSLAALLSVLPDDCGIDKEDGKYVASYITSDECGAYTESNPVDACYKMVIHLYEQNLLRLWTSKTSCKTK